MNVWVHSKWRTLRVSSLRVIKASEKETYFIGLVPLHFRTPLWPVFKLRNEKFRSRRECNSRTWRCHFYLPCFQANKIKSFLANYRPFASIRLQKKKTQQWLSGYFPHTAATQLLSSFNASLSLWLSKNSFSAYAFTFLADIKLAYLLHEMK